VDVLLHTKFTVPLLARCKTMMIAHGASWFTHPELYGRLDVLYIRLMMPRYCRRADAILSNSRLTTDDFVRFLGVPREKLATIHAAADPRFQPIADDAEGQRIRDLYGLPERFLLTVGRYDPRKNLATLVTAFETSQARRQGVKLVMVGGGADACRRDLEIDARGLGDSIVFTGYVEQADLPAFYSLASAFVFPSVYEEFGIPLCEAMMCGCPIIASNTGAIPEITGGAALLAAPFDAPAFADAIDRLLGDEALSTSLRTRGLARARAFTWSRSAAETLRVIEAVAAGATDIRGEADRRPPLP
jgi:glycosyltransferase involved in cell wall biosynthesis